MKGESDILAGYSIERASRQDLIWSAKVQKWSSNIECCSTEDKARNRIIEIWTNIGDAHNQRNFDHQAYPWSTVFAEDFSCDISHTDKRQFTLEEYLASRSHLYSKNESLRAELLSLITQVDVANGTAAVYSEQRVSGWEGDLTKIFMVAGTLREARNGGRWLVCRWSIMQGMDVPLRRYKLRQKPDHTRLGQVPGSVPRWETL